MCESVKCVKVKKRGITYFNNVMLSSVKSIVNAIAL